MGDIGLLNVSFSAKTLPELLAFHDAFENLIKYDKQVFKSYLDTITEIERTKNALDLEKAVLQEFIKQLVEENDILEKTKNEKQVLLTNVRTKEKLQKLAIDEMQQATEQLSRSMVEQKSKSEVSEERFLARKGSLPSPVDGAIITNFGQEKVNSLGIPRKSEGIELKAPDGTRVSAVAEGEVIFSGYLRGYGNTVIIHHGWQYYTVTSRMEKLLVAKGQQVKAETPIGIMGDTAMLFDEGLYFEIRRGRQPMDPLVWLNPNRISTQHELSPESSGNKNTSIH
jgi:septal ring factor EnvC (AmiA/AmiB activator)